MTFHALTYSGQYPPLHPRSSVDIASFTNLHASLRTVPELSKEGDKILNEEMLAKFVDGVVRFQRDHLGRKSKSKYWPTVALPSPIFADRSSYPTGPLGIAILSAFRIKQVSQWRNFNMDNPKLFDDNIAIIKKMEEDLRNRGYLSRPVIYFDTSVERIGSGAVGSSKGGEIQRLTKIALRFGARVVTDIKDMSEVTHIVAYDPEEHDAAEVIEEEMRSAAAAAAGGGAGRGLLRKDGEDGATGGEEEDIWSSEKKYLKTLTVVDVPIDDDDDDASSASTPSGAKKATKKMALVHWWYHPSSYDEWMPAEDVDVGGDLDVEDPHPGIPGGPCVVACKFVRDVDKFNEWGVESDYAIADYERKIDYIQRKKNENVISTSASSKKPSKNKRVVASKAEPSHSEGSEDIEDGHAAKKRRMDDATIVDGGATAATSASTQSKKSKTKSSINPTPSPSSIIHSQSRQSSERRLGMGMNPRRILTGIRGSRNEVIRRTVYDGALRVEDEPYKIIKEAMADYLLGSDVRSSNSSSNNFITPLPTLSARPEWRKLLPLTGFIRPSVHTSLKYMTVTELTLAEESLLGEMDTDISVVVPTIAKNVIVPILISPELNGVDIERGGVEGDEPLTIRGGGLEEESGDFATPQQQEEEACESNVPAVEERNKEVVAQPNVENSEQPISKSGNDELELNPATHDAEDMQVESTEDAVEETATEDIQDATTEHQEDEIPKETPSEVIQEVDATATSADVVTTPSSTSDQKAVEVDVPAAADETDVRAVEKKEAPESTEVECTEAAIEDKAPPSQDEAAVQQPPKGTTASSTATVTQPTTASASTTDATPGNTGALPTAVINDVVSSTNVATVTSTAVASNSPAVCQVISLPPNTQLSNSLYRPTSTSAEDDSSRTIVRPSWYHATKASDFEKRTLPEWFNSSAPHRTEAAYISTRETILNLAKCNTQLFITTTTIRRSVAGDAGSLLRLHKFLMDWGLLNAGQIGETAPSDAVLRGVHAVGGALARSKRRHSQVQQHSVSWTAARMHALEISVVKHTSKKADDGNNQLTIIVDWDAVAADLGEGVTASDCQLAFLNPPTDDDVKFAAGALPSNTNWLLSQFLEGVRPEVLKAAVEASLQFTDDITEVRKASIVAALASAAAEKGTQIESEIETTLMDIVDQRLQRLENRVAILDDVEALLEAERVSLELERRDMYTTRCRHWFGDGSS